MMGAETPGVLYDGQRQDVRQERTKRCERAMDERERPGDGDLGHRNIARLGNLLNADKMREDERRISRSR